MFKKLFLVTLIVLGVLYGSGTDFASIKRSIKSAANENARELTASSGNDWGDGSGY